MKTTPVTVGVVKETAQGERRVSLVPAVMAKLLDAGISVLVEHGAGDGARIPDDGYAEAGAEIVPAAELDDRADVVLCVQPPDPARVAGLRTGQVLVGLLGCATNEALVTACEKSGVTAVDLNLLPRTLSRAQTMDALTSQANFAGYKAALVAAAAYEHYFPMMVTAAGSAKPARVLVLGAGVAGLSAIATARRLGAVVTGYDIRPEAADDVRSTGAKFLDLSAVGGTGGPVPVPGKLDGGGGGGYARVLSAEERDAQQAALQQSIGDFDIVITTAQVPGRRPPLLVTKPALDRMRAGSVVVDVAAGPFGGNVEGVEPDREQVLSNGVTLIGAGDLPSSMAAGASTAYARNITALLTIIVRDGEVVIDPDDELVSAMTAVRPDEPSRDA